MENSTARAAEGGPRGSGETADPGAEAVVLLNFGGPRDPGEVADFLFEILRDPNTIQLPVPHWLQDRLARFIAGRRAPETIRQYGGEWKLVVCRSMVPSACCAASR